MGHIAQRCVPACRFLGNVVGAAETTINQLLATLVLVAQDPEVKGRLVEEQQQVGACTTCCLSLLTNNNQWTVGATGASARKATPMASLARSR